MEHPRTSASDISREDVLTAIEGDGRFFVVVSKMRRHMQNPTIDERVIDRALQRERKAGVVESVSRRWRRVSIENALARIAQLQEPDLQHVIDDINGRT